MYMLSKGGWYLCVCQPFLRNKFAWFKSLHTS